MQWRFHGIMNIAESEQPVRVIAKTCGCEKGRKKVTYSFIDAYHDLCVDKKDIISSELEACENLLKHTADKADRKSVEIEIAELKMALDLMP
jgi:hypothetical protein